MKSSAASPAICTFCIHSVSGRCCTSYPGSRLFEPVVRNFFLEPPKAPGTFSYSRLLIRAEVRTFPPKCSRRVCTRGQKRPHTLLRTFPEIWVSARLNVPAVVSDSDPRIMSGTQIFKTFFQRLKVAYSRLFFSPSFPPRPKVPADVGASSGCDKLFQSRPPGGGDAEDYSDYIAI